MRVGVQQAGPARAGVQEAVQQQPGEVALRLRAVPDHLGQRLALQPLGDEHPLAAGDDLRDRDVRVAVVGLGERALPAGFEAVVEFLGDAGPQLDQQRLHVEARGEPGEQPGEPGQLC